MDVNTLAQWAGIIGVIVVLVGFWISRRAERDRYTEWKTRADIKLALIDDDWKQKVQSIDVAWKPGVDSRLETLEDRQLNIEKQFAKNSETIVEKLELINNNIGTLVTEVAVMNKSLEYSQKRVGELENKLQ